MATIAAAAAFFFEALVAVSQAAFSVWACAPAVDSLRAQSPAALCKRCETNSTPPRVRQCSLGLRAESRLGRPLVGTNLWTDVGVPRAGVPTSRPYLPR